MPDPAKPSTPWHALLRISTRSASPCPFARNVHRQRFAVMAEQGVDVALDIEPRGLDRRA